MDRPGAFATLCDKGRAGCRCGAGHADGLKPSLSYVLRDALRGKALFWLGVALCAASAAAAPASPLAALRGAGPRTLSIGAVARYAALALGAVCVSRVALAKGAFSPSRGAAAAAEARAARDGGDAAAKHRILAKAPAYAARLAAALRCETVSYERDDAERSADLGEFEKLHALLEAWFPRVHAALERTVVNRGSLIFRWQGSTAEAPYAVYAHLDVVPPGSADGWDRPPFRGDVAADASGEECVWGRGAIDDKNMVLAHLEAVEDLLEAGVSPRRDVYLLFGHDEEVGGLDGAKRVAAHLRDVSGVARFDFLLDEGLFVTEGVVPSHAKPVAMICVAEKGFANVKLTCRSPPGHASVPGPDGALGRLARAVARLERRPMPSRPSVALAMFATLRGGFSWPLELVVSNLWLFGPVLAAVLASKPETASLVRTTTAVTIFRSGQKKNVLPDEAVAYVNHRLHPDDSLDDVLAHDRRVIADPYDADHPWGVKVEVEDFTPPSKVSTADHAAFRHLRAATLEVFGDVAVAPALFIAASDSKHFWDFTDNIYRYNPILLRKTDRENELKRFHGYNERIATAALARQVAFYRSFHLRCAG